MILIEIGDDMARFASPARLACWAALNPGNNESAGVSLRQISMN